MPGFAKVSPGDVGVSGLCVCITDVVIPSWNQKLTGTGTLVGWNTGYTSSIQYVSYFIVHVAEAMLCASYM